MAVTFDAVGPSSAGTNQTGTLPQSPALTWNHTCSGGNRLAIVGVATGTSSNDTTFALAVTYDGASMTSMGRVEGGPTTVNGYVEMFKLVNPPTGVKQVSVVLTGPPGDGFSIEAGSVSFNGVDQVTSTRNTATNNNDNSATPSVVVTSAVGNMVVTALACGNSISASSQTERWVNNQNSASRGGNGGQQTAAGAASVTMQHTISSDGWGIIGVDIVADTGLSSTTYPSDMTPGCNVVFDLV